MKTHQHALIGAVSAVLPDLFLLGFALRREWVPEGDPWVRAHRFLHGPGGIGIALTLGFASHVIADHCSPHSGPDGVMPQLTHDWLRRQFE